MINSKEFITYNLQFLFLNFFIIVPFVKVKALYFQEFWYFYLRFDFAKIFDAK
jgi:hypothetical protein